jgi:integrase/recombinase XerD
MFHGVRGFFRFAHIDGLIPSDPAVYARLPKVHQDDRAPRAWTASS